MRRALWTCLTLALCGSATLAIAADQQAKPGKPKSDEAGETPTISSATTKGDRAYRLDFTINELEDGKRVNSRLYSMNLTSASRPNQLKIGTRVPVETEQ